MVEIFTFEQFSDDKIKLMWNTLYNLYIIKDKPVGWKLTPPFLDSLCVLLNVPTEPTYNLILKEKFLGVGIDITTKQPCLIGENGFFVLY